MRINVRKMVINARGGNDQNTGSGHSLLLRLQSFSPLLPTLLSTAPHFIVTLSLPDDRVVYPGPIWDPYSFQYNPPPSCPQVELGPPESNRRQGVRPAVSQSVYWDMPLPLPLLPPTYPQYPSFNPLHPLSQYPGSYPQGWNQFSADPGNSPHPHADVGPGAGPFPRPEPSGQQPMYSQPQRPMEQRPTVQAPGGDGPTGEGPMGESPAEEKPLEEGAVDAPTQALVPHIDEDGAQETYLGTSTSTAPPNTTERGAIARKSKSTLESCVCYTLRKQLS